MHNILGYYLDEHFKAVEGFENYLVSNYGRILNLDTGRILKPRSNNGYQAVMLCKNGEEKQVFVHRLVAQAFIPNIENKPQVNHIDENKANNHLSNLEWVTAKENINHGTRTERQAKAKCKPVLVLDIDYNEVGVFDSIKQACEVLSVDRGNASKVASGKQPHTKNLVFAYVADLEEVI
nr:NUMOD4 domain-containing protein [uncultured Cellulosilyticum sp.]